MLLDASIISLLPKHLNPPPPGPATPAFIIADAGSKGAGLFALRDIPAGALILVDQPILVVPAIAPTGAYDVLLPRLPKTSRDALFALTNAKSASECGIFEGVVWTNASQIDLPASTGDSNVSEYGAVFPVLSRANHSCSLSTTLKWDPGSFSAALYAQRTLRAGEEIHHPYIDVLAPRAVRRVQLADRYNFHCACPHCDVPDATAAASDAARAELHTWLSRPSFQLPCYWSHWDLRRADDADAANLRALALAGQEGLDALRVMLTEEIALGCALLGDEARFCVWAAQVAELCEGYDPVRATEFRAWEASPQTTFRLWGWRAKQRLRRFRVEAYGPWAKRASYYFTHFATKCSVRLSARSVDSVFTS
ncbi:hypothetical protein B0H16DRAFT_1730611 [Mycena metata]|uniref:SET domain-containing protein n=1 Tax=Mycena metata TaxID=1033252 RepID=A0AAD7MX61_9AGAR|nr:hypothetical protein B0H16DRAFT_1730611 [Mycena metata]